MKIEILQAIYQAYEDWSAQQIEIACQPGCNVCCTTNVMITALEGELILKFIDQEKKSKWLAQALLSITNDLQAGPTTNEFAQACLNEEELETRQENHVSKKSCPFLKNNLCAIYQARPFGCRCFASQKKCRPEGEGILPTHMISAATATQQIIEHLGQRQMWGNMLDVLLALTGLPQYKKVAEHLSNNNHQAYAQARLRSAKPLPAFLIPPEDRQDVEVLLNKIFSSKVDGTTIENILNG